MKERREFDDFLRNILEHAEAALEFVVTAPNHEALTADRRTFWAVI